MTDRQQIPADWASRGFSCDVWTDPPGRRWKDFTHANDDLTVDFSHFSGVAIRRDRWPLSLGEIGSQEREADLEMLSI